MVMKSRKIVSALLAFVLAFANMPALQAAKGESEIWVNLLAQDMDTQFAGGTSPFTLENSANGGSQKIVQIDGKNAVEFRDSSVNNENQGGYFYYQLASGALVSRINQVYALPVGSAPVEFVLEYKLKRTAASDKPINNDIYARVQFGNYDNVLIPRFPVPDKSTITNTAAYKNAAPNEMLTVNDSDIASYRMTIVPNGGQRLISTFKLEFSVRVNSGGTDEAIAVTDLAVYEVMQDAAEVDTEPPTAPANLTESGKTDTSVNLTWTEATDNVGVTRYDIYQNGQLIGFVGGLLTSYTASGLTPNTTYQYTVKARDAVANISGASNEISVTTNPSAGGLPEPFGNLDIGSVRLAGSATYDESTATFTLKASGADIWGTDDSFQYMYRPWVGDGQIVARVANMENTVAWTKAGVMIRESISPQSRHAMMAVSPSNGVVFEDRLTPGGASTLTTGAAAPAPYWVKLVRIGNVISAYDSADGENWTLVKKEVVSLPETVYFGLALTSHDVNRLSVTEFSDVSIEDVPPQESNYSPFPGTIETRKQWLWNKTKAMSEVGGPMNIVQYVAQILDGQNVAGNLKKLDDMYKTHDWEEYKTVSKMYAYLLVGDQFDSTMMQHVKDYFAGYKYAKLNQTENLRMSNYVSGYLVGQYLPDVVDLVGAYPRTVPYNEGGGNSGATLKAMNRANIEEMIDAGVHDGWAEYESPEYTFMTYLCLNAIYQYTDEPDFKQKVKMAMDVMWFEWANDWIDGQFISTSNRAKGDSVSVSDPSWRGVDHTALSWMYFGAHRAQETIGESDAMVPSAYRPYLEYLGMVYAPSMTYTPPEMAIRIGQLADKDYTYRKTNLQNSSGRNLKTYRQAYVKPTWGLATEVTYNRVDNWIEDIPVALRWHSSSPASLFRVNADQGTSPIGNYDQPENHRIMQDEKAAVGVFKSLSAPGATDNFLNAMYPDTGAIKKKEEQSGWVFSDTGSMYFAFKMIKPYSWYYQTPTDPSNKVKTTAQLHPTAQLSYSYNILRSQADKNGWVLETADASEYPDLDSFKNAILTRTTLDSSHIDDANPRLMYTNLSGHVMDITFDLASGSYNNTHKIDGTAIDYASFKLFDTPWLQQDIDSEIFTASQGGEALTYDFASWTISNKDPNVIVDATGVTLSPSTLMLAAGKSASLKAIFEPVDATNRNVTWNSSNTSIATVSASGKVTGIAPGMAVISVTTEDGSFTADCTVTVVLEPFLDDSFQEGLANWESYSSTVWQIKGSGAAAQLAGSTTLTGPQRIMVKASLLPYTTQDYSMAFTATADRFRTMFRYSSGTNYYFLEFKRNVNVDVVEMWKYADSSSPSQVGTTVDIQALIPDFNLTESHRYEIEVYGNEFKLFIDDTLIATFNDASLQAGGVGYALKSVGPEVNLLVDEVRIMPIVAAPVTVEVTGVSLNQNTLALNVGDTATLLATVNPADATNKAVTWKTSDPLIATVDSNGKVTAVSAGTAEVTVTTVDGEFGETCVVAVTAKNDSSPGGNEGPDDGSGQTPGTGGGQTSTPQGPATGTTTVPSAPPAASEGIVTVPADSLKNGSNGRSVVELPANTTEVKLPSNAAALLGENKLEVKTDELVLEIPSGLFKQLAGQISAAELQGSVISLKLEPLKPYDAQQLLAKGQPFSNAAIQQGSAIYELSLTLTTEGGTTKKLTTFDQPIVIRLKVEASMNPKLAGIYYIADEGRLEWIGGQYANGEMTALIHHFSKYAVLEVKKNFADMAPAHWAYKVIQELAAKQLIQGTSATKFEPDRTVTRAEFAAMLVKALKLTKTGVMPFGDVPADKWFAQAVSIAYEAGIVNGTGAATFDPNGNITREQMVVMTMKAYRMIDGPAAEVAGAAFTDAAQISRWAVEDVKEAAALELVRGRASGRFMPKGNSTRAEAAQMIYGLISLQ